MDSTTPGSKLHLGCGKVILPGWINLDIAAGDGVDLVFDLERCGELHLPIADDQIQEIRGLHLIEHIDRVLPFMQEMWRIAASGCRFHLAMPYGSTDMAWADPTHKRPMFVRSFHYFQQPFYNFADYGYRGDWMFDKATFRIPRALAGSSTAEQLLARVDQERNLVLEFLVDLVAVKPARPTDRAQLTNPAVSFQLV